MSETQVAGDVFSNLPPEAIQHILQLLPLRDAARTSILSKCWRYKWLSLPHLILDYNQFYYPISRVRRCLGILEYSNMISNILLRHIGPIPKFALYLPKAFSDDISHWLEFVACRDVKEFTLRHETERKVPSCLFTCVGFSNLTHLTLINCRILSFPSTFKGFPSLVSLTVHHWNDNSNLHKLEVLIAWCPKLEHLVIEGISKDDALIIHAPKLHSLVIYGKISDIFWEGSLNIQSLSLDVFKSSESHMVKFLSGVPGVEKLLLKGWHSIFEFWFKEVAPMKNPAIEFGLLRTLVLSEVPLDSQLTISFIVRLLLASPRLQKFVIHGSTELQKLKGEAEKCEPWDNSLEDCSLGYLKNVNVVCAGDFSGVLQLIKFLLASSPVLEVMIFDVTKNNAQAVQKLNMATKLLQHRRASTRAEIIFKT